MNTPLDPPEFALEWCRRLGASPANLKPLLGGINNQVFRLNAGSQFHVLKAFSENRPDRDNRFKAEVEFLTYAQDVAPQFVPRLLYIDVASLSMVLDYLIGERPREGTHPSLDDINCAVEFFRCLNNDLELAKKLLSMTAADGFLLLSEHLLNIRHRIDNMGVEHLPKGMQASAGKVLRSLQNQLDKLHADTAQRISRGLCEDALNPQLMCISPSDFGFHNAIRTSEGLKFFDFEFAGWDDPVKAVVDFDLQPRVPVLQRVSSLSRGLAISWDSLKERYEALLPILKLKWACIILSPLNQSRWAHSSVLGNHAAVTDLQAKLFLAQAYLVKD